jgi:hypothetical protein
LVSRLILARALISQRAMKTSVVVVHLDVFEDRGAGLGF